MYSWLDDDVLTDVIEAEPGYFIACGTRGLYRHYHGFNEIPVISIVKFDMFGDTVWVKDVGFDGRSPRLCRGDGDRFYLLSDIYVGLNPQEVMLFTIDFDGRIYDEVSLGANLADPKRLFRARDGSLVYIGDAAALPGTGNQLDMIVMRIHPQGFIYWRNRFTAHYYTLGNWIEETPRHTYLASGTAGSRIWAVEIDTNGVEIRRQIFYQTPTRAVLDETACVKQVPGGRFIASGNPLSYSPNFFYLGSYSTFSSSSEIWGGEKTNASCLIPQIQDDGSIVLLNVVDRSYFTKLRADSSVVWNLAVPRVRRTVFPLFNAYTYLEDSSIVAVGIYLEDPDPMNTAPDYYFTRIQGIGRPYIPSEPTATKAVYRGLPLLIAYPTPATTTLIVHTRAQETLQLMNLSGQVVRTAKPDQGGTTQIDVGALPPGMYLLRQGQATVKVIKE